MAEKRKDDKGRILRQGETQRKDGRYSFKYKALDGKRKEVYAKTLPELREKEEQIRQDLRDGIDSERADALTVNDIYDEMQAYRQLKRTTLASKNGMYDKHIRDGIGKRKIATLRHNDITNFYKSLLIKSKLQISSISMVHSMLNSCFEYALKSDIVRRNPTKGALQELRQKRNLDDKQKKRALTKEEQERFLEFVKYNYLNGWHELMTVFLGTGCRVSEIVGLRWDDVDFRNGIIDINHNLLYVADKDGRYSYYADTTKTATGKRQIPMLKDVRRALLEVREKQFREQPTQPIIDGYTNFVFLNRSNKLHNDSTINSFIKRAVTKYNAQAPEGEQLPHFSVHILRHTFITRLCEVEDNMKAIQAIAGHSDISTTMDVYAEATKERNEEAMKKLDGKMSLG